MLGQIQQFVTALELLLSALQLLSCVAALSARNQVKALRRELRRDRRWSHRAFRRHSRRLSHLELTQQSDANSGPS